MAQLTLEWSHGNYSRVTEHMPRRGSVILSPGDEPVEMIVLEGNTIPYGAQRCAAIYESLAKVKSPAAALTFVNRFGFLHSRGRSAPVETITKGAAEVRELLAAKKNDNWDGAVAWMTERPRLGVGLTIGLDETGRHQLEFRPRDLFTFIVAQLLTDWGNGAQYQFCKRPGCGTYFYFGPGTGRRETAEYCSPRCRMAHAYSERKEGRRP